MNHEFSPRKIVSRENKEFEELDIFENINACYRCIKCELVIVYYYHSIFDKKTGPKYKFYDNKFFIGMSFSYAEPSIEEVMNEFYEMIGLNCEEFMVNEIMVE